MAVRHTRRTRVAEELLSQNDSVDRDSFNAHRAAPGRGGCGLFSLAWINKYAVGRVIGRHTIILPMVLISLPVPGSVSAVQIDTGLIAIDAQLTSSFCPACIHSSPACPS